MPGGHTPDTGPIRNLVRDIYRERVLCARRIPPTEKLLDGPRLFEAACRVTRDGIWNQHPDADEHQVAEILARRLALRERLESGQ